MRFWDCVPRSPSTSFLVELCKQILYAGCSENTSNGYAVTLTHSHMVLWVDAVVNLDLCCLQQICGKKDVPNSFPTRPNLLLTARHNHE